MSESSQPFGRRAPPPTGAPSPREGSGPSAPERRSPISPLILLILVAVIVAQLSPISGIFLLMLGGPFWSAILVNLLLVALAADAIRGALPRAFLAIPVAAYLANLAASGAGYLEYRQQRDLIERRNASQVTLFNPARDDLVVPYENDAARLAADYQLRAVFTPNPNVAPATHVSLRVLPKPGCDGLPRGPIGPATANVVQSGGIVLTNLCALRLDEDPETAPFSVSIAKPQAPAANSLLLMDLSTYSVTAPDGRASVYQTGTAGILSPIPQPIIGCTLDDQANAWRCFAHMSRSLLRIGPPIDTLHNGAGATAIANLLGLKPRTIVIVPSPVRFGANTGRADLAQATRIASDSDAALALAARLEGAGAESALALLPAYLQGDRRRRPDFEAIARHGDRTAPYSQALALAFAQAIERRDDSEIYNLGLVIAALPSAAFQTIGPYLLQWEAQPGIAAKASGSLLIRLGDLGAPSLPVLLQSLRSGDDRILKPAILGLCRLGAEATRSAPDISTALGAQRRPSEEYAAAYVTYRRLGRPDLAQAVIAPPNSRLREQIEDEVKAVTSASPRRVCRTGTMGELPDAAWLQ